jgi:HipA-like protein
MEILNVYLNDTLVGELWREGTELSFRYVESYLALPVPLPLSGHLPFSRQTPNHVSGDLGHPPATVAASTRDLLL